MPWDAPVDTEIVPIHAALVPSSPTGGIVFFEGFFGDRRGRSFLYHCEPEEGEPQVVPLPDVADDLGNRNLFCAGHAQLADGRWLVVGGTGVGEAIVEAHIHGHGGSGIRDTWAYLPRAGEWRRLANMNPQPDSELRGGGRWYPTCVTLGNGRVLAFGGHPVGRGEDMADDFPDPGGRRHNNNTPEVYVPGQDRWIVLSDEANRQNFALDEYNRLHLTPTGQVFFSTVTKLHQDTRLMNPVTGAFAQSGYGQHADDRYDDANCSAVTTSVLLPLLHGDPNEVWVLVTGSLAPERINLAANDPQWMSAGNRQSFEGLASPPERNNLHGIILPTGQVFLAFGVRDDRTAVSSPEIYTPAIDWGTGRYQTDDDGVALAGVWDTLTAAADQSDRRRGYHSVAVLQPDGSVWAGGSTHNIGEGTLTDPSVATDERSFEVFRPNYGGNRPTIEAAPLSVSYGDSIAITMGANAAMQRVALVRCGSFTHAFDSDQRYLTLPFTQAGATITATAPESHNLAPPGYYLLFVLRDDNTPSAHGRFIRLAQQDHYAVLQQSIYSLLALRALLPPHTSAEEAVFGQAIDLIFEGFLPHELNAPAEVPTVTFRFTSGDATVPGMRIDLVAEDFEVNPTNNPDTAQRFRYVYDVVFENEDAFDTFEDDQVRLVEVRGTLGGRTIAVNLTLMKRANPFMRDGDPPWLSTDLRIHKATVGDVNAVGGPQAYVQGLLDAFENHPAADDSDSHPFEALDTSQEANPVVLAVPQDEQGTLNFAVARVRFLSVPGEDAEGVKVFFRLFNTVGTALEYNPATTYRTLDGTGGRIPALGRQGFAIISIPFFAAERVTPNQAMDEQNDNLVNRRTLFGAGPETVYRYFGCWLDVNSLEEHFPRYPQDDGPYGEGSFFEDLLEGGPPQPMLSHIAGYHQCLVAEIQYDDDPISLGDTPFTSDNLAQRNLATVPVANPGLEGITRTAQTTMDVKPSDAPTAALVAGTAPAGSTVSRRLRPDELVFIRNDLPVGTAVEIHLPDVDIEEVLTLSSLRNGPPTLQKIDEHTLRFTLGRVNYVALPGGRDLNIAGLLSVTLPLGIVSGEVYTLSVKQYSGRTLRWVGAFEFRIPVAHGPDLMPDEAHKLAILRYVFERMPERDRWHPVFERYLYEIGERVRGFGGDPDRVKPSPHGTSMPGDTTCPEDDGPMSPCHDREPLDYTACVSGRICDIEYDCFGRFQGFSVTPCDGAPRRVRALTDAEQAVLVAWRERRSVTVHLRRKSKSGPVNRTCPWSGQPVADYATAEFEGMTVGFCAPAHRDRFVRVLEAAGQPHGHAAPAPNRDCPWSGRPVVRDAVVRLSAGSVGFCSRTHAERFQLAIKYFREIIRRLDADGNPPAQTAPADAGGGGGHPHGGHPEPTAGAAAPPSSINRSCPWTRKPVSADALTTFYGYSVGFHLAGDRDRFEAAARIAGASRARESEHAGHEGDDHRPINTTCPISGAPAQPGVTAQVGTSKVAFCSITHRDEFIAAVAHFRACARQASDCGDADLVRLVLNC